MITTNTDQRTSDLYLTTDRNTWTATDMADHISVRRALLKLTERGAYVTTQDVRKRARRAGLTDAAVSTYLGGLAAAGEAHRALFLVLDAPMGPSTRAYWGAGPELSTRLNGVGGALDYDPAECIRFRPVTANVGGGWLIWDDFLARLVPTENTPDMTLQDVAARMLAEAAAAHQDSNDRLSAEWRWSADRLATALKPV